MYLARASLVIILASFYVYPIDSITFDFNLIWFEANKTVGHNYTARRELPDSFQNVSRIHLNQKVPILLRRFDLSSAKHLKTLIMDNCAINDMEIGCLNNLPPLENLTITRNNIKLIREGVFDKRKVKHLDLSHNKIATIAPGAFNEMEDLVSINLDYNELTSYALSFENCPNLTKISVQYNFLLYLPNDMFKYSMDRKISVYFSFNKISKIHSAAFDLNQFEDLYLDHNELTMFESSLKKVDTLNLNVNNISCVGEEFLNKEVSKATRITLYENPFTCECYNQVFKLKNVLVGRPTDC